MKIAFPSFMVLLLGVSVVAQDAPTIQQCRADVAMWSPQPYAESFFDALSMAELDHRHTILLQCGIAGASQRGGNKVTFDEALEIDQWMQLDGIYNSHEIGRLLNYIKRHGEWEQFNKEDAAGRR
jgi:hypothetical protein